MLVRDVTLLLCKAHSLDSRSEIMEVVLDSLGKLSLSLSRHRHRRVILIGLRRTSLEKHQGSGDWALRVCNNT